MNVWSLLKSVSGNSKIAKLFILAMICTAAAVAFGQEKLAFSPEDTLDDIRTKIEYNGYDFTVDHNWVYDLPAEKKAEMFRPRIAPPPEKRVIIPHTDELLAVSKNSKAAAAKFDWRSYNGHSYIGAVRNQGNLGSCYSFGACAAAESTYNFKNGLYDSNCVDFAEMYIVWTLSSAAVYGAHFGGGGGADYDYYELYGLTAGGPPEGAVGFEGVCYEANFPYSDSSTSPGQAAIDASKSYPRVQFEKWYRCYPSNYADTTAAIKTAISTYGCVDAAVYVSNAFQSYSGGVYEDTNTQPSTNPYYYTTTNHAISLVGWDDDPNGDGNTSDGCWILRNSWGTGWGENGYMRIKYFCAAVNTAAAYLEAQGGGGGGSYSISGTITLAQGAPDTDDAAEDMTALKKLKYTAKAGKGVKASAQELGVPLMEMIADPNVNTFKVLPPPQMADGKQYKKATVNITYLGPGEGLYGDNAVDWPNEAKNAFTYAANIWGNLLQSSVPITIKACWVDNLPQGVLGHGGPLNFFRDFANAPKSETFYHVALANSLAGQDLDPNDADIYIGYSSTFSWYYGTDGNCPNNQMDLVTVAAHEIAHGLGFSGSMRVASGVGTWGFGQGYEFPAAYDTFAVNGSNQSLVSGFPNNSAALASQLTSDNVFFNGANAKAANSGQNVKLYAPSSWAQGSSFSHLDEIFNNTPDALMTYSAGPGEVLHSAGPVTIGLMKDLGWVPSGGGGGGSGLAGVLVSDGTRTATTDNDGKFTITGVPAGTYTVTPVKSGYTFNPPIRSVTVNGNVTSCDFIASQGGGGAIIIVTSPTSGASYNVGDTVPITWTSSGVTGDVYITVMLNGNPASNPTQTANDGSFNWDTTGWTGPSSNLYQIKIANQNETVVGQSPTFTLNDGGGGGASINVTSPLSGASYNIGATVPIRWTSSGITGNVNLTVFENDEAISNTISVSNNGSYDWNTAGWTGPSSDSYQIRVASQDDSVYGMSPYFSLTGGGGGGGDFNVTVGSTFVIPYGEEFDKKPTVYATGGALGTKKKSVKVTNQFPNAEVECLWTAKCAAGTYELWVKGKVGGEKVEEAVGTVTVMPPEITGADGFDPEACGEIVEVTGNYFSTKPKVYITYNKDTGCGPKGCKKSCKIDAWEFNTDTGESALNFIIPKFKNDGSESDFELLIKTGTGEGTHGL